MITMRTQNNESSVEGMYSPSLDLAYYKAIVDSSYDAIITGDSEGRIRSWNRGAELLYGYKAEEVMGRRWFFLIPTELLDEIKPTIEKILRGQRVSHMETKRFRKNGELVDVSLCISPVVNKKTGNVIGVSAISRDISRTKELRKKLLLQAIELQRSNYDLEQFAYVVSHDLQSPLRLISSYLRLLNEELANINPKVEEYISSSIEASHQLEKLLRDLLKYSRARLSSVRKKENLSLENVIKVVMRNLKSEIESAGAQIIVGNLPQVYGNESLFVQIFQNLIENSIKYREAGRSLVVEIYTREKDSSIEFEVADNGMGVNEKHLDRVFMIFQRLHEPGSYLGTGIGLSIVKKLVERYGGKIWMRSKEGVGTRVIFSLPKATILSST